MAPPTSWCQRCFHPISGEDWAFVEAYREIAGVDAKVTFHLRCYTPGGSTYFDARVIQMAHGIAPEPEVAAFRRAHLEAIGRGEMPGSRARRASRR